MFEFLKPEKRMERWRDKSARQLEKIRDMALENPQVCEKALDLLEDVGGKTACCYMVSIVDQYPDRAPRVIASLKRNGGSTAEWNIGSLAQKHEQHAALAIETLQQMSTQEAVDAIERIGRQYERHAVQAVQALYAMNKQNAPHMMAAIGKQHKESCPVVIVALNVLLDFQAGPASDDPAIQNNIVDIVKTFTKSTTLVAAIGSAGPEARLPLSAVFNRLNKTGQFGKDDMLIRVFESATGLIDAIEQVFPAQAPDEIVSAVVSEPKDEPAPELAAAATL